MKAIIPVAGLGTRMLPATKAIPKELLPVYYLPIINYVVENFISVSSKVSKYKERYIASDMAVKGELLFFKISREWSELFRLRK